MKKFIALLLLVFMIVPCVACGGTGDEQGVINIAAYKGGYGLKWLYDIKDKFTEDTGIKVKIEEYPGELGVQSINTDITSNISVADLIISKGMMFDEVYKGERTVNGVKYDNLLEDLTDLYSQKVTGEEITLKDKMDANFSEYYKVNDKYYATPWASGTIGILRNKDFWDASWKVPNTTNEMFALLDQIKASSKVPFIYSLEDEYWSMFSHVWIAQYMGSENIKKFYQGYNADGVRYEPTIFMDKACDSTLDILEKLLKHENGYMHDKSKTANFTLMQGLFLKGQAIMTPNGDWIENEMSGSYKNVNIEFIKTPVNSALADKLSFKNEANKDEILSELITYADANKTGYENMPAKVTEADVDKVRDARSIEYTVGNDHFMAIPSYANSKEEAKKFILYMASDKAIKQYIESTNGSILPYEFDYKNYLETARTGEDAFSQFRKDTTDRISESNLMFISRKDRIFSLGGVDLFWYNDKTQGRVIPALSAENSKDYHSAQQIRDYNNSYLERNWSDIKLRAHV